LAAYSFIISHGTNGRLGPFPVPIREIVMHLTVAHIQPIVALVAGVLILVMPRLLNFIVAIYLIVVGIMGLGLFR
jgi:hypothetical protein